MDRIAEINRLYGSCANLGAPFAAKFGGQCAVTGLRFGPRETIRMGLGQPITAAGIEILSFAQRCCGRVDAPFQSVDALGGSDGSWGVLRGSTPPRRVDVRNGRANGRTVAQIRASARGCVAVVRGA